MSFTDNTPEYAAGEDSPGVARVEMDRENDRGFLFEFRADTGGTIEELRLLPTEIYDYSVHVAEGEAARWCRERNS